MGLRNCDFNNYMIEFIILRSYNLIIEYKTKIILFMNISEEVNDIEDVIIYSSRIYR